MTYDLTASGSGCLRRRPSVDDFLRRDPVATGTALSAADPHFRDAPHDVLDELRRREPVHQDRAFDRVVLTRAEDVRQMLADRTLSSDPRRSRPGSYSRVQFGVDEDFQPTLLHMDDPDHGRLRGLLTRAFDQRAIQAMRPAIEDTVEGLLDAVAGRPAFDVIASLARPLAIRVVATVLGVDASDEQDFAAWSEAQIEFFNPSRTDEQESRLHWAEDELTRYLTDAVARRRVHRTGDLISHLLGPVGDDSPHTDVEIIDLCRILLVAGNVTTIDLIGNGVVALLTHPGELAKLAEDSGRIGAVIEETLRFDPPVTTAGRQPLADREIGGCPVSKGQPIIALLSAANHDPDLHDDPHAFDIDRASKRHFAFGGGAHHCIGASLATAEGQIAVSSLFRRFPGLRLSSRHPLERKAMPSLSGFKAVWVERKPATEGEQQL